MFDDRIAPAIKQRRFELAVRFDMKHFDTDAIMELGHGFDAVDNRRAVVVAIGEADGAHSHFVLQPS